MIITMHSTKTVAHERARVAWAEYARLGALTGIRPATGRCAVSPVQAPSTGEVRPQAGNAFRMHIALGATDKGDVWVRSLGPPI